jgi:nitrogen fixation/metabolism regulation signal transduction histidine kinase
MKNLRVIRHSVWYRLGRGALILFALIVLSLVCSHALLDAAGIESGPVTQLIGFTACVLLIVLLALSGLRIIRFMLDKRRGIPGAMIRTRLAFFFVLASLVPLVLSGIFVYVFFSAGMDVVYNPDVENALDLSARFVRESRDSLFRDFGSYSRRYFLGRNGLFEERVKQGGTFEFERIGRYKPNGGFLPEPLRRHLVGPADENNLFAEIDGDKTRLIYLAVTNGMAEYASIIMHPVYGPGAERVVGALAEYRRLRLVRKPLATALVFMAVLFVSLVTLTSLLLAMRFARIIADPVRELVEGTRRIARGELEYRVADVGIDEFAQLVDNFNNMSNELRQSRQRLFHAERIAAWQEVARRLAHEIKNPLTPIQLGAERILRQSRKGSESLAQIIEKVLPAMIGEVKAIEKLVDEFSSFARLPGKRIGPVILADFV